MMQSLTSSIDIDNTYIVNRFNKLKNTKTITSSGAKTVLCVQTVPLIVMLENQNVKIYFRKPSHFK